MSVWLGLAGVAALLWIMLLLLPWRPWSTAERLRVAQAPAAGAAPVGTDEVTAVVPARNEADHLEATLRALRVQCPQPSIVVVDDQSTDGTAAVAARVQGVRVVDGHPLPAGWTGKLWALNQGLQQVRTPLVLFVDADIELRPGVLAALLARLRQGNLALVSVMAHLAMRTRWERLLLPAFIYFFKLLYPFSLANGPRRRFHAAAGGCMLLDRRALEAVGGIAALRGAVIDDCALARRIKRAGYRTWTGLSRDVVSTRRYPHLRDTWQMVARTAYTQLGRSVLALLVCSALLVLSFLVPLVALVAGPDGARTAGLAALAAMFTSYLPVVRFYGLPAAHAATLPIAAVLFLAMTWSSAVSHWRGVAARWKDREYAAVSSDGPSATE